MNTLNKKNGFTPWFKAKKPCKECNSLEGVYVRKWIIKEPEPIRIAFKVKCNICKIEYMHETQKGVIINE